MVVKGSLIAPLKHRYSRILQLDRTGDADLIRSESGNDNLSYVHVPFCEELCPYCSFNRFPLDKDVARKYFENLRQEARLYVHRGFDFTALYVGLDTPTVLPEEVGMLFDELRHFFGIRGISLETNPNHLIDDNIRYIPPAKHQSHWVICSMVYLKGANLDWSYDL